MSTLAAYLRDRTADDVRRLAPDERVRFSLALGDDDLRLYCAASGIATEEARRRLRAGRQAGRRPSGAAAGQ